MSKAKSEALNRKKMETETDNGCKKCREKGHSMKSCKYHITKHEDKQDREEREVEKEEEEEE